MKVGDRVRCALEMPIASGGTFTHKATITHIRPLTRRSIKYRPSVVVLLDGGLDQRAEFDVDDVSPLSIIELLGELTT